MKGIADGLRLRVLQQVRGSGGRWRCGEEPDLEALMRLRGEGLVRRSSLFGGLKRVQWSLTARGELMLRQELRRGERDG